MENTINVKKIVKYAVSGLIILVLLFNIFGTVKTGQLGIKLRFGAVTGKVLSPGVYMKLPFVEKVVRMDVQTQKEQADANSASKDLQTVSATVAINYAIDPTRIVGLYSTLGKTFKGTVIDPAIQEAVKSTTANFTAEELITKREEVSQDITNILREKLSPLGISVSTISIVNFDFSKSFNQSIEAKVTAEQDALAAKNKLEQIKYEKEQAIVSAQGRAEALRIESNAISGNPKVVELRAIEKWDGHLPIYTGGAMPFVGIK